MTYSIHSIKEKLYPVFELYGVKKATLFGSYSKGEETDYSDIDILVNSGLTGLNYFGLLDDVAALFDVPVDMIDSQDLVANSKLSDEINSSGVVLYER